MSQIHLDDLTIQGYQPPLNTQFTVFLDNRVGKLLELIEVFNGHALELVALSLADSADHAVVRLVTSYAELAFRLLKRHNTPFSETEVLVVELDSGKTLAGMCRSLLSAELSIHYAYSLTVRPRGLAAIVLHTDDQLLAGEVLRRKAFTLLGENDLGGNASHGTPGPTTN